MEFVSKAQLVSEHARRYFADILPLVRDVVEATTDTAILYLRFIMAVLRPFILIFFEAVRRLRPYITIAAIHFWNGFWKQSHQTKMLEVFLVGALVIVALIERRYSIVKRTRRKYKALSKIASKTYRDIHTSVRKQSLLAASALPHALFLIFSVSFEWLIRSRLPSFIRTFSLILVTFIRPGIRTVLLMYSLDVEYVGDSRGNTSDDYSSSCSDDSEAMADRKNAKSPRGQACSSSKPPMHPRKCSSRISSAFRRRGAIVAHEIENSDREVNGPPIEMGFLKNSSLKTDSEVSVAKSNELNSHETSSGFSELQKIEKDASCSSPKVLPATGLQRAHHRARHRSSQFESMRLKEDNVLDGTKEEIFMLQFWTASSLILAVRALAHFLCPSLLFEILAKIDVFLFYFFTWMQIGLTRGAPCVYMFLATLSGKYGPRELTASTRDESKKLNYLLLLLTASGLLKEEQARAIGTAIAESGLALLASIVFFITPRPVTFIGTLFIGVLVPAYFSASTLQLSSGAALSRSNWLTYWVVYSTLDWVSQLLLQYVGWVPLWYHVKLGVILWLQMPYYRGSSYLLDRSLARLSGIATAVSKHTVTPRKRKLQ